VEKLKRRDFIKSAAATIGGFHILPSGLLANSPNGKVCTAHIGIGGKGNSDLGLIASHPGVQVVGLCDVDKVRGGADKKLEKYSSAKFFHDYREMLDELGDKIDAVVISTPDHTHYPATLAAMNAGKHVYTQKPLVHKIAEARHLMELAREKQLVTQMGIQIHSSIAYRMAAKYIKDGAIGKISKVYVWSGKDWGYDGAPYTGEDAIPESLKWDLWLGTAAKRPYLDRKYHPGQWRRILDFGCGTLGDMGVHIFDTPYRALELTAPKWVETTCRKPNNFSHPTKNIVRYGFPETSYTTKELLWTWYDGGYGPPADEPDLKLPEGQNIPQEGAMFVGENGRMLLPHIAGPWFLPKTIFETVQKPELEPIDHYHQWVDGILGAGEPSANFDYSSPLTETVLLGVVGNRFPGKKLEWDRDKMKFTNRPEANKLIKGKYRGNF
jgi:predicted dehydrogenase